MGSRISIWKVLAGVALAASLAACGGTSSRGTEEAATERGQYGVFYLVAVSHPTGGTVTSTDGQIACGPAGGMENACGPAVYPWAEVATLQAIPDAGNVLISWAGDCTGLGACTLEAGADRTVVAVFGKPGSGHPNLSDPGEHGPAYDSQSYGGNPLVCTGCHGPTLQGQGIAPACSACHSWPRPVEVTYTVGGAVNGLTGEGLVLATPGLADLPVPAGAASFAFANPVLDGTGYDVGVVQQPTNPHQICSVANGAGVVASANVTGISVSCADSFVIGGVASGLAGSGLTLASPGQPDIVLPAGATSFAFPDRVPGGAPFSVSVVRHPQGPAQTCAVSAGSGVVGTTDVGTVTVSCGGEWSQLAVGGGHTVGIRPDGTLWAWGSNAYGQLGIGTSDPLVPVSVPVQVGLDTDWTSVSAGDSHTVAVKADGSLWAWGFNQYGQVGDGFAGTDAPSPVWIAPGTSWKSVSSGANHTLAIRSDGTLWSWGDATYGQLGRGLPGVAASSPTQVGTGTTWASVAAGAFHSLAVQSTGSLWGWGFNQTGQVGNGSASPGVGFPVQVGGGTTWASAAGGLQHSVGIATDGSLLTWGYNASGQLGSGAIGGPNVTVPTRVGAGTGWARASAGIYHSVATGSDGSLWAWGSDVQGQVTGTPSGVAITSPTRIGTGTAWFRALAGGYDSAALANDGTIWTWGSNAFGQIGDGTTLGAGLAP